MRAKNEIPEESFKDVKQELHQIKGNYDQLNTDHTSLREPLQPDGQVVEAYEQQRLHCLHHPPIFRCGLHRVVPERLQKVRGSEERSDKLRTTKLATKALNAATILAIRPNPFPCFASLVSVPSLTIRSST